MGEEATVTSETLDYFRARQCSNQWRAFLRAFTAELFTHAEEEDAHGFMSQLGQRMAAELVLGVCETLKDLEAAMNGHWSDLDWGWCQLIEDDRAVLIRHAAWPMPDQSDVHWPAAIAALLEGVYTVWFRGQGGDENLRATSVPDANAAITGVLEFRYAY